MSIHAVPDERSVKRLGTRLVRAQRQQKSRSLERLWNSWWSVRGSGVRKRTPTLRNHRLLRRIPKNVPLARFLNGIPPHRFEPLN